MVAVVLPPRWAGLLNEEGEVDGFLISPLGYLGPHLRVAAARGSYGTDASPDDLAVVLDRDDTVMLVAASPVRQIAGPQLSADEFKMVLNFVETNRVALLRHWTGNTDSIGLLDEIERPG